MISEKDFLRYEKQTSKLYEDLELDLINDIAQRIADVGELNTVGYNNAVILQQMGNLYEDIINDVAKHNQMSSAEVKKIFDNAGITSIKKDDIIYKQAGVSPGKISNTLYNIMERQADDTNYNILRLTRTIANTGQEQFINAINQAYLETSSGMKSYSQAIIDAVDKVGKQGAIVKYPSGVTRSVESAIRMNVLTAVGQMSGELQLERAQEVGWDLVEVSAHIGARPEHAEWQGKVYSLSGSNGYKDFYKETGYGSMLGLCGINCRHTFFPFYKGSTLTYTKNELEEMKNAKVHYNGQEMSYYDATQLQRRMERQIRQNRKDIAGLEGLKNSDVDAEQLQSELIKANNKLAQRQNILDDFIRQTEFKDNDRTYIGSAKSNLTDLKKKEKTKPPVVKEEQKSNVVEGKNIIGEFKRRKDEFEFEIEDVINKQGFDGKPKVVDYEEFKDAMKQSGFYAERTYSANTQEILDEYRNQLYNGKWYVDCSEGGAQYGKGMYCASSYDINNNKQMGGIGWEMSHYQILNQEKGNSLAYTEGITLDKSAKILKIPYGEDTTFISNEYAKQYALKYANESQLANVKKYIELDDKIIELSQGDVDWGGEAGQQIGNLVSEARKLRADFQGLIDEARAKAFRRDAGSLAVEMGYDAIRAEGHGQSGSYTVILNRTKVIFNKGGSIYGN